MKRLTWIGLIICVLAVQLSYADSETSVQIPERGDILNTLKPNHPRLTSTDRFERIRQAIQDGDPAAMNAWRQVKEKADRTLSEEPFEYKTRDGRRLHRLPVRRIRALAMAFLVTGEQKYADRAWAELESLANFKHWNPIHFLDAAQMTHATALGYDWLYDQWTPEQRDLLAEAILEKGLKEGRRRYNNRIGWHTRNHNWNQVCNGGLVAGALAIADREPEIASEILSHALASIQLPMKGYEPDGATWEGVSYWDFGSRYNILLLDAVKSALGTDFGLSEVGAFKESGDYPIYISGTDRLAFDFADSRLVDVSAAQHMWMGRKYNIPRYSWFRYHALASGVAAEPLDLLWFDGRAKSYDISQMPLDRRFRKNDVASMRDTWKNSKGFVVAMHGGENDALSHRHLDLGTFILECDGVRWIIDLGREDEVYQRHRTGVESRWHFYRLRTEGHNTYVMNLDQDGGNQERRAAARITHFDSQSDRAEAIMDLSQAYPLARTLTRKFTLQRRESFTVSDTIECTEAVDLRSFFHTKADIELSDDKQTATLKQDGRTLQVQLIEPTDAVFTVLPAEPGPASPQLPSLQTPNDDVHKLTIHLKEVKQTEVEVVFTR